LSPKKAPTYRSARNSVKFEVLTTFRYKRIAYPSFIYILPAGSQLSDLDSQLTKESDRLNIYHLHLSPTQEPWPMGLAPTSNRLS